MRIVRTVAELRTLVRAARHDGARVGLVPTMGAFHEGHLSLMRRAHACCDLVIVSLFVNPAQFNDPADLVRYPRDEAHDAMLAKGAGVHMLFAPDTAEVYPAGFSTTVEVSGVSAPLEGVVRGTAHFRGVATVVAKLLNMAQPDDAFFGQKDAQQALLVRRMVRDLDLPVRIEVCPTVREADGLAMSSRNAYLTEDERVAAPAVHQALQAGRAAIDAGATDPAVVRAAMAAVLDAEPLAQLDYAEVVDAATFGVPDPLVGTLRLLVAARFGRARLIDNLGATVGATA